MEKLNPLPKTSLSFSLEPQSKALWVRLVSIFGSTTETPLSFLWWRDYKEGSFLWAHKGVRCMNPPHTQTHKKQVRHQHEWKIVRVEDKSLLNHWVSSALELWGKECGAVALGVARLRVFFFSKTRWIKIISKMGSSTLLPLYVPTPLKNTQLPRAARLMFVLIWLPKLERGREGGEEREFILGTWLWRPYGCMDTDNFSKTLSYHLLLYDIYSCRILKKKIEKLHKL